MRTPRARKKGAVEGRQLRLRREREKAQSKWRAFFYIDDHGRGEGNWMVGSSEHISE
jgi:hypothetical protein